MKRKREQKKKKKNKMQPQRSSPLPPIFVSPFPLSHIYIWRLGRGEETGGGEERSSFVVFHQLDSQRLSS